jgi:probable rRNA maturation factor
MAVHYINHEIKVSVKNKRSISNWIKEIISKHSKKTGNIQFIYTSDKEIIEVNKKFLKHNYYTDVITFDYSHDDIIEGDIFISIDTILSNSQKFATTFDEELHRVMIHGILHLIGFTDKTLAERKEMTEKENESLNIFYKRYE